MSDEIRENNANIFKINSLLADLNRSVNSEIKSLEDQISNLNRLYIATNERIDTIESAFSEQSQFYILPN